MGRDTTITAVTCCPVAETNKTITKRNSKSLQTVCVHITLSELQSICPAQTNCSSDVFINLAIKTVNMY